MIKKMLAMVLILGLLLPSSAVYADVGIGEYGTASVNIDEGVIGSLGFKSGGEGDQNVFDRLVKSVVQGKDTSSGLSKNLKPFETPTWYRYSNNVVITPLYYKGGLMSLWSTKNVTLGDLTDKRSDHTSDIFIKNNSGKSALTVGTFGDFASSDLNYQITTNLIAERDVDFYAGNYLQMFVSYYTKNVVQDSSNSYKDLLICIDNYGNLVTNNKDIILPFFMNPYITKRANSDKPNHEYYINLPALRDANNADTLLGTGSGVRNITFADYPAYNVNNASYLSERIKDLDPNITIQKIKDRYSNVLSSYNRELVGYIEIKGDKKIPHDGILQSVKDKSILPYDFGNVKASPSGLGKDASEQLKGNLLNQMNRMFQEGIGYVVEVTVSSLVESVYQTLLPLINGVFRTPTFIDTVIWQVATGFVLKAAILVSFLYFVISLFGILLGKYRLRKEIVGIALSYLIILLPVLYYPNIVDILFNKPSEKIADTQIKQMFVLDQWIAKQKDQVDNLKKTDLAAFVPDNSLIRYRNSANRYDIMLPTRLSGRMDKVYLLPFSYNDLETYYKSKETNLTQFIAKRYADNKTSTFSKYGDYEEITDEKVSPIKGSEILKTIRSYNEGKSQDLITKLTAISTSALQDESTREVDFMANQDYLNIGNLLSALQINACDAIDSNVATGCKKKLVTDMNYSIISNFNSLYFDVSRKVNDSSLYAATDEGLDLLMFFELSGNKNVGFTKLPTSIEKSNISADTYLKALMIPLTEFNPNATYTDNVAKYVGERMDILTILNFGLFVIVLILYGIVKSGFIILFAALVMVASLLVVVLRAPKRPLIIGLCLTLGTLALAHIGFMILWIVLVMVNNSPFFVITSGSLGSANAILSGLGFPLALMTYIFLVVKYVYIPVGKMVVKDWQALGGNELSAKYGSMAEKIASKITPLKQVRDFLKNSATNNTLESKSEVDTGENGDKDLTKLPLDASKDGDSSLLGDLLKFDKVKTVAKVFEGNKTESTESSESAKQFEGDIVKSDETINGFTKDFKDIGFASSLFSRLKDKGVNAVLDGSKISFVEDMKTISPLIEELKGEIEKEKTFADNTKSTTIGSTFKRSIGDKETLLENSGLGWEIAKELKEKGFISEITENGDTLKLSNKVSKDRITKMVDTLEKDKKTFKDRNIDDSFASVLADKFAKGDSSELSIDTLKMLDEKGLIEYHANDDGSISNVKLGKGISEDNFISSVKQLSEFSEEDKQKILLDGVKSGKSSNEKMLKILEENGMISNVSSTADSGGLKSFKANVDAISNPVENVVSLAEYGSVTYNGELLKKVKAEGGLTEGVDYGVSGDKIVMYTEEGKSLINASLESYKSELKSMSKNINAKFVQEFEQKGKSERVVYDDYKAGTNIYKDRVSDSSLTPTEVKKLVSAIGLKGIDSITNTNSDHQRDFARFKTLHSKLSLKADNILDVDGEIEFRTLDLTATREEMKDYTELLNKFSSAITGKKAKPAPAPVGKLEGF